MPTNSKHYAFTLIELLIAVAIIGILAAIALPSFNAALLRARIAGTQANFKTLQNAFACYNTDNSTGIPYLVFFNCAVFSLLTTPVAYIGSCEVARDVFHPGFVNDAEGAVVATIKSPCYIYYPVLIFSRTFQSTNRGDYLLLSYGPDKNRDLHYFAIDPMYYSDRTWMDSVYASSNGLVSSGDLIADNSTVY